DEGADQRQRAIGNGERRRAARLGLLALAQGSAEIISRHGQNPCESSGKLAPEVVNGSFTVTDGVSENALCGKALSVLQPAHSVDFGSAVLRQFGTTDLGFGG